MKPRIKKPSQCSQEELDGFEHLIIEGGEVSPIGLRRRIEAAEQLIFIGKDPLLAVGAIKNPNPNYRNSVFEKAGVSEQSGNFVYELGWLYASPNARGKGVGNDLMTAALKASDGNGVFATTRSNNEAMHHLLKKYGFNKLGADYASSQGDYTLVLYGYAS